MTRILGRRLAGLLAASLCCAVALAVGSPGAGRPRPAGRAGRRVVNTISGTLTPVSTATGVAGRPVRTGIYTYPTVIELTPSGATAGGIGTYPGRATPVSTRTGKGTAPITVGLY